MNCKILFQRGRFRLEMTKIASKETIQLVSNTVWGTPGNTQWRQMLTSRFIPQVLAPYWFSLIHGDKLLVTLVLSHRKVSFSDESVDSYFVRYLTLNENMRDENNRKAKQQKSRKSTKKSLIRRCMIGIFEAPEHISFDDTSVHKAVFYAFVELKNIRSMELCKTFGFEAIRNFSTVPFSRFFPKKHPHVFKIEEQEKTKLLILLQQYYKNYHFYFSDHTFNIGEYFVLKKEGEIVAGLQIMREQWKIDHLPNFSGKLILNILPKLPLISRIFNPKDFRLALFESIYVKEGHEADLLLLMESALAEFNLHTAFIWLDQESPLYKQLKKSGKLGFISKLKKDAPAQVIARFHNFSKEEIAQFGERPAYLSAFDMA